jgi:acyl carrier protein phosphodiesterase
MTAPAQSAKLGARPRLKRRPDHVEAMNYLAHLYLADYSEDALLGALLGDFVSGRALESWPAQTRLEILVHRRIDSHTDAHPAVRALKARFPQGQRRFAGIALDVYFDHLLARDWPQHHPEPLDRFASRVYQVLLQRGHSLPPRLARIAPLMAAGDWLGSYRDRDSVDRAVERIAERLSRGGEALRSCLPRLRQHQAEAEHAFAELLPELARFSARVRLQLSTANGPQGDAPAA